MLTDRLQDAINRQINNGLSSAHLYLCMSAYFETLDLNSSDGELRRMKQQ